MNGNKKYWLNEARRYLALALIGARKKSREMINKAIECLNKHEETNNK
ncbi:MAG: hypothetical protein ACFFG0_22900 [Candidatus Thorarchaeota archaeon]